MRIVLLLLCWFALPHLVLADIPEEPASNTAAPPQEIPRVVMARVGSREITVEAFMQFLAKNPTRVQEATTPEGKADLLRTAIANELLMLAMQEEKLVPENPSEEDLKKGFTQLMGKHFPPPAVGDEQEQRAYYQAHLSEFGIPASVRLSQIQFRVKENATPEEKAATRKRAEDALKRVESGEAFSEVAAELTENPRAKENKGDVGFIWREGNAWLDNALEGIKVGGHTKVLESPVGYDILMLTDERETITTPFEDAREQVIKKIQLERQKEARAAYVKTLANRFGVEILLDEMKESYPNGVFP